MQHFVETPIFTRQLVKLMPDEEYRVLQWSLVLRPDQADLTTEQVKILRKFVREELA
jgi:hypothetical protein